jgi:hypothetical protein
MRKAVVFLIAFGTLAFVAPRPALSFSVKIGGNPSADEIRKTCGKNGGHFSMDEKTGGYECDGRKGTVFCDKNGNCEGRCSRCGGTAARGSVGGILSNTTGAKAQPLQPQQVTTQAGRTPMQQKVTRSPKTAQPTRAQKTTGSAKASATQATTAPSSMRRNVH